MTDEEIFRSAVEICAQTIPVLLLATVFSPSIRSNLAWVRVETKDGVTKRPRYPRAVRRSGWFALFTYLLSLVILVWDVLGLFYPSIFEGVGGLITFLNAIAVAALVGILLAEVVAHLWLSDETDA